MKWLLVLFFVGLSAQAEWQLEIMEGPLRGMRCTNNITDVATAFSSDLLGTWRPVAKTLPREADTESLIFKMLSILPPPTRLNFTLAFGSFDDAYGGRYDRSSLTIVVSGSEDGDRGGAVSVAIATLDMITTEPDTLEFCYLDPSREARRLFLKLRRRPYGEPLYSEIRLHRKSLTLQLALHPLYPTGESTSREPQRFLRFVAENCATHLEG